MKGISATLLPLTLMLSAGVAQANQADVPSQQAPAEPAERELRAVPWTGGSALTAPEGRWEFGVFHPLHWVVSEGVELSLQPLLFGVMPNLAVKVNWYAQGALFVSSRHGVSYPSFLLSLLAKEGALGLLPPQSQVPQGIIIDSDVLVTVAAAEGHWVSVEMGFQCAPRGPGNMPVVDFPFLYPRFGVLSADGVFHAGVSAEGNIVAALGYSADIDLWWIPATEGGYALEHGFSLTWRLSDHVALALGYRLSQAAYPAGVQRHVLPYGDVLFGF